MNRMMFLLALLGAATPALAGTPDDAALNNARNWDVMLDQYPARARAAGEQGPVGFRAVLDRDGYASACEVTSSSGYPLLDAETCRLILTRTSFKGITDANGRKANAVFQGVLHWKLPNGASNGTPAVMTAQAAAPEKVICRKKLRTGSLASFERTCLTKSEWRRYTDREREYWQEQQGIKGSTRGP